MENRPALSTRRDVFLDERGSGLRVTWHPERDLVVLSVWQEDSCVGTFRMAVQDVPRLSGLLAAALGDWVDLEGPHGGGPGTPPGDAGSGSLRGATASSVPAGLGGTAAPGTMAPAPGVGGAGHGGAGLSLQQRLRLSRPVLRLRGLQDRRRRSA